MGQWLISWLSMAASATLLSRMGIDHEVVSGDIRNYVELVGTVKNRTRLFDHYFPSRHGLDLGHVERWMTLFIFYYNRIRSHLSLNDNSPVLAGRGIDIGTEYERLLYVLATEVLC